MNAIYKYINHLANNQRRLIEKNSLNRGYSGAQGRILHFLFSSKDKVIHQKDIEKEFGLRAPTATEVLRNMESKGIIKRVAGREDARYKEIILTEEASQYEEDVISDMEKLQQCLIHDIDEEELKTWVKVSQKMLANLEER